MCGDSFPRLGDLAARRCTPHRTQRKERRGQRDPGFQPPRRCFCWQPWGISTGEFQIPGALSIINDKEPLSVNSIRQLFQRIVFD